MRSKKYIHNITESLSRSEKKSANQSKKKSIDRSRIWHTLIIVHCPAILVDLLPFTQHGNECEISLRNCTHTQANTRWKSDTVVVMIHYHWSEADKMILDILWFHGNKKNECVRAPFFLYHFKTKGIHWMNVYRIHPANKKKLIYCFDSVKWIRLIVHRMTKMMIGHFLFWAISKSNRMQKIDDRRQNWTHHCRIRFWKVVTSWKWKCAIRTQHDLTAFH